MGAILGMKALARDLGRPFRAYCTFRQYWGWCLLKTRAQLRHWLNSPKDLSSHGGALCPSRQVQVRIFPPDLHLHGAQGTTLGARDIQEKKKWQRPSSYRQSQSPFLGLQRATRQVCRTSNVPVLVPRSGVRLVKSLTTASASRGLPSAASRVPCPTTSVSKSAERSASFGAHNNSQALRLLERGSRAVFRRLNDNWALCSASKGTA